MVFRQRINTATHESYDIISDEEAIHTLNEAGDLLIEGKIVA